MNKSRKFSFPTKSKKVDPQKLLSEEMKHSVYRFVTDYKKVKELLDSGADVDAIEATSGKNLLHEYVSADFKCYRLTQYSNIDFLIKNGANVDMKTSKGETPLHLALNGLPDARSPYDRQHQINTIKKLLEAGANPNSLTSLQTEFSKTDPYYGTIIKIIMPSGSTPLQYAVALGNITAVKYLVKKTEVDISIRNDENKNCLDYAIKNIDGPMVDFLLQNGADKEQLPNDFILQEKLRNADAIGSLKPTNVPFNSTFVGCISNHHSDRAENLNQNICCIPVVDLAIAGIVKIKNQNKLKYVIKMLEQMPVSLRDEIYKNSYRLNNVFVFIKTMENYNEKYKTCLKKDSFDGFLNSTYSFERLKALSDLKDHTSNYLTPSQIKEGYDNLVKKELVLSSDIVSGLSYYGKINKIKGKLEQNLKLIFKDKRLYLNAYETVKDLHKFEKKPIRENTFDPTM